VNKRQLIAISARRSSLTQREVREAWEAIQEAIVGALDEGDHVTLSGFGRFEMQPYAGRKLRRFDGAGHYEVKNRQVPVFRSSKLLRQRLRRKEP
jgi:DNA-binding protein HU-beta